MSDRLVAAASAQARGAQGGASGDGAEANKLAVTLYKNGFTVNDGPLRDPTANPADKTFLDDLLAGNMPAELRGKLAPGPVDVSLNDKRGEDFRPPTPPAYVAFSGEGQALSGGGSSADGGIVITGEAQAYPAATPGPDDTLTRVRVQLVGGKRVLLKLPESCTVLTLQGEVARAAPDVPAFTLHAGFPPAALTDPNSTLKAAGLCNAAVTQKPM